MKTTIWCFEIDNYKTTACSLSPEDTIPRCLYPANSEHHRRAHPKHHPSQCARTLVTTRTIYSMMTVKSDRKEEQEQDRPPATPDSANMTTGNKTTDASHCRRSSTGAADKTSLPHRAFLNNEHRESTAVCKYENRHHHQRWNQPYIR